MEEVLDADLKRFPVENVSWDDIQLFFVQLNARDQEAGWHYRLPTVAESEYACRGGPLDDKEASAFDYCIDHPTNQLLPEQANFGHDKSLKRTCKVGSFPRNRLGLCDMHGNVWEWCHDAGSMKVGLGTRPFRGGCWSGAPGCRAATTYWNQSAYRAKDVGFRVARVPAATAMQYKLPD